MDSVRFYFSFRSPYSGLAFHRINPLVEGQSLFLVRAQMLSCR